MQGEVEERWHVRTFERLREIVGGKAERLVETVKLRNALIREAAKLLPEAIRQAKPKGGRKRKDDRSTPARAGSAALIGPKKWQRTILGL